MDMFNATVHFTPAHIFTSSFPSPFLFLQDAVKVSSGIPFIIETKVREEFSFQGKQFPYSCCHLALVKIYWDPVTDVQLWQIHVPLCMQGIYIQSLIQSLDTQAYFITPHLQNTSWHLYHPTHKKYCRSVVVVSQCCDKILPSDLCGTVRIFIKCHVGRENSLL